MLTSPIQEKKLTFKFNRNQYLSDHLSDPEKLNQHFLRVPGKQHASLTDITYFYAHTYTASVFNLDPVDATTLRKIIDNRKIKSNAMGCDEISLFFFFLMK